VLKNAYKQAWLDLENSKLERISELTYPTT
jgi:hypothetical protein